MLNGPMQGGGLAQLLQQHGAPATDDEGSDPLSTLQEVIEDVHSKLLPALKDPDDVNDAVKVLGVLTGIQKRLMGEQSGNSPGR